MVKQEKPSIWFRIFLVYPYWTFLFLISLAHPPIGIFLYFYFKVKREEREHKQRESERQELLQTIQQQGVKLTPAQYRRLTV